MDLDKLIKVAIDASKNSYSPYSKFKVGASLLTKEGQYFGGCNVENSSYGLTNCAERTCLFSAYAAGVRKEDIVAFVEYSPKEHLVSPCGACRQVMSELLDLDCPVYIVYGSKPTIVKTTIRELMPLTFTKEDIDNA